MKTAKKKASSTLHTSRARIESSRIAHDKKVERIKADTAQTAIVGVMLCSMLVVVIGVIAIQFTKPERQVSSKVEALAANYYENSLYKTVSASSNYKESLKKGSVPGEEVSLEAEFSSPVPQTITFNEPGIIFFPYQRGTKTAACCVFSSLIDYLSYSTLIKKGNTFGLPVKYDCIIVNNVRNFPDALLDCEEYQRIYCILPNTDVGRVMAYTIQHRNKGRYVDVSKIYNGYEDLHDFMTNQKIQDIYE